MKRFLIYLFCLVSFVLIIQKQSVQAQQYGTCDQCGLCIENTSPPNIRDFPENWNDCRKCLYPSAAPTPVNFETLVVTYDTNTLTYSQTTPYPGRYYTGIGCIATNLSDFSQPDAAAALVKPLLNILLSVGGGIAFLYLLYGAFLIVTSRSDPEQLSQGRRTIYGAIIGIVFAMSSVFLINLIANGILKIPGFSK